MFQIFAEFAIRSGESFQLEYANTKLRSRLSFIIDVSINSPKPFLCITILELAAVCHSIYDFIKNLKKKINSREYKEALRQQRNQDSTAIYRPKEQQTPTDSTPSSTDSPTSFKSQNSTPSPTTFSSNQSSPMSPPPSTTLQIANQLDQQKTKNGQTNGNGKPVQKVTPSRNANATYQSPTNWTINGNHKTVEITTTVTKEYNVYVKPSSPTKSATPNLGYNNVPAPSLVNTNGKGNGTNKVGPKSNR